METETSDSFNFATQRMSRPEAATYLGVSPEFLEQDVTTKRHSIPVIKLGRKVAYLKTDLDAWVMSRRIA